MAVGVVVDVVTAGVVVGGGGGRSWTSWLTCWSLCWLHIGSTSLTASVQRGCRCGI